MKEQTAVLILDHGEWILVVDSDEDEPERAWKDPDDAIRELRQEGWEVAEGPGPIRPSFEELSELDRFEPWGYRLRRVIQ